MTKKTYRTWATGEIVTAAMMNEQIRDNGNAIWVGTTEGDIDYYTSATTKTRLPVGTNGQVLVVRAGVPSWKTAFVGCKTKRTTVQGIPYNVDTEVSFNDEYFDDAAFHDVSINPGRITIPVGYAGRYLIGFNCSWVSDNAGYRRAKIVLNGTTTLGGVEEIFDAGTGSLYQSVSTVHDLAEGDYIQALVRHNLTSTTLNLSTDVLPTLWIMKQGV